MFKHLLVPLDGSRLAEAALPLAALLAKKLSASVTLLHLIERDAPRNIHGERHLADTEEASAYLEEAARRAFPPDVKVECHVDTERRADVAHRIAEHVEEVGADLVVLCTHGRRGLRRLLAGSIAQQVVAQDACPVMLIRPSDAGGPPPLSCERILVPLDGVALHEHGLPAAAELAHACGAALHLVVVVPTLQTLTGEQAATGILLPGATKAVLELARENAQSYLERNLSQLQIQDLKVTGEVSRGDPTAMIVRAARQVRADMIVLGTHGKAGMAAFWSGSIAPRIASSTRLPVMLVPLPKHSQEL